MSRSGGLGDVYKRQSRGLSHARLKDYAMQVSKKRVAGRHDQDLRHRPLHRWHVTQACYVRQAHPQVRAGAILG